MNIERKLTMNWLFAEQKSRGIRPETVADLIKILQEYPQDWPIRTSDESHFCQISTATDGRDKLVSLI